MDFDDIDKVTRFAVKKYGIKYPKNMTLEEFVHEVRVFIFRYCHLEKPRPTAIIQNVRWTSAALFKKQIESRSKIKYRSFLNPNFAKGGRGPRQESYWKYAESLDETNSCDSRDEVEEILDLPMADEYKEILKNLASGLDPSEVYDKMGLSRQTYSLKKKIVFNKVRALMSDY